MHEKPVILRAGSRRRFLGGATALALLPGVAVAQHLTANAAPQPVPGQDTANLAAKTDDADHLTVEVHINGAGPYRFVVDTGAERSVIADNVAAALNLPAGKPVTVSGLSGRIPTTTVTVDTLAFGPFSRNRLDLPVLSRTSLFADGFLGLDAINGSRVTFDFHNHAVRIEQPHSRIDLDPNSLPDASATRVKAHGSSGRLRVTDCLVDSIASTAFIDTGAEVSVGNPALKEALAFRNRNLMDLGTMVLTGVTGGQTVGDIIPVSRISLEDLNFTNGTLCIADVPDFDDWNLHIRPALLIGLDYLRQFASITIDYRLKEIRFELSQALPHPSPGVEIDVLT